MLPPANPAADGRTRIAGTPVAGRADELDSFLWLAWRQLGMPLFYPLFALGCGVALAVAAGVRMVYWHRQARVRALRRSLSFISRNWFRLACALKLLEWEAIDRPSRTAGHLIIANHPTLIDALFLIAVEPQLCCVLKAELNANWVYRLLISELDYLSNHDPEALLAEGEARLRRGETLLVFPEGTRTVPGERVSFRQGAAAIAVRAEAPVLPLFIDYHGAYLSKGYPWYRLPKQRMRYRLVYGAPLATGLLTTGDMRAARAERRRVRRELTALLERWVSDAQAQSWLPQARRPLSAVVGER
ncbi:MAG: lysophospholipid acyltransferase family protein [Pseudomonadota bacterium]